MNHGTTLYLTAYKHHAIITADRKVDGVWDTNFTAPLFVIEYSEPLAQAHIEYLVDGQDTAQTIVDGKGDGWSLDLSTLSDYYDIHSCDVEGVDPDEVTPFTVAMTTLGQLWEPFGEYLVRIGFNRETISA